MSMEIPRPPKIILFDWHATLVNAADAMYAAMNDMLEQLDTLGLSERLSEPDGSKTADDQKLLRYVRDHHALHPKILREKKVSRTDLLEVLFGDDHEAKQIAHKAFNNCYRRHFGEVQPFEPEVLGVLSEIRKLGIRIAVLSNRSREFLQQELERVEQGEWFGLFESVVSGDDSPALKPAPDPILKAIADMQAEPGHDVWFVGDSTTDMIAAQKAGVTGIFFNGAGWSRRWIKTIFPGTDKHPWKPDFVVDHFRDLLRLVNLSIVADELAKEHHFVPYTRKMLPLPKPSAIVFDWHATLADTLDAMYNAVDDMLPRLKALGLVDRLVDPSMSKNANDAKLVKYVRDHFQLHPKIKAARKISRTDIFEVLFGDDEAAKQIAHREFNVCYRNHYGAVTPFEPRTRKMLEFLRGKGIPVGVLSNRDREFLLQELSVIEGSGWLHLFDTVVAGDDTPRRKPWPDPIAKAVSNLGLKQDKHIWYVGDSTTDVISSANAQVTGVFYNGAQWSDSWLDRIFPGTPRHPHRPDAIVDNFAEFERLVEISLTSASQE